MTETTADAVASAGAQPTQYEKIRAIPWSLAYDVANTFFVQLTFFWIRLYSLPRRAGIKRITNRVVAFHHAFPWSAFLIHYTAGG